MRPDDGLPFASHIRAKLDSSSDPLAFIRCDVQNAFGAVHRDQVLQAARSVDPLFAKCLAPWLECWIVNLVTTYNLPGASPKGIPLAPWSFPKLLLALSPLTPVPPSAP